MLHSRWVRILLVIAIVGCLVVYAGLPEIVHGMRRALPLPVGLAFLAVAAEVGLRTLNWRQLLIAVQPNSIVQYQRLLGIYLSAGLLGTFAPSSAGTDLLRSGMSHRRFGGRFVSHVVAVLLQNAVTAVVACVLALVGCAALWRAGQLPEVLLPIAMISLAIAIGTPLGYAALRYRRDLLTALIRKLGRRWYRWRRSLRRLFRSTLVLGHSQLGLGRFMLVAAGALACQALGYALLGWALGVELPVAAWILLPAVAALANLLPASFLGFGATQAANSFVLAALGVQLADAVAIATLATLVSLCFRAVAGGAAMVFWPSRVT